MVDNHRKNRPYPKELTTYQKVIKFLGEAVVTLLPICGLVQAFYEWITGQRGLILSSIIITACIWMICETYDVYAARHGWGKQHSKKDPK